MRSSKSVKFLKICILSTITFLFISQLYIFHARATQKTNVANANLVPLLAQSSTTVQSPAVEDSLASERIPEVVDQTLSSNRQKLEIPLLFNSTVVFTFIWVLIGVSVNYGFRMYWNSPIHPSFLPFVFITMASIIAFSVVLAFEITIGGAIEFEILGQKFSGASGPAVLWVLTFLAIMAGFRLTDASKLASSDVPPNPPSHHLIRRREK